MKNSNACRVALALLLLLITCFTASCSSGSPGPTAAGAWEITGIQWPKKYLSDAIPGVCTVSASVYVPERQGVNCWARLFHRTEPSGFQQTVADTSHWTPGTMTHVYSFGYDSIGSGIYTLQVGISLQGDDLFSANEAVEWYPYNFFVDRSYYYHDVDIEYVYQHGCDLFQGGFDFDETVANAYRGTRVAFNFFERSDASTPLPQEPVRYDTDAFLEYRHGYGLYWHPDTYDNPILRYFLAGVTEFLDSDADTVIDNIGGGKSGESHRAGCQRSHTGSVPL